MVYPYILLNPEINVHPIVDFKTPPMQIILDNEKTAKALSLMGDSVAINDWFDQMIKDGGAEWAIGAYMENREPILSKYPHMENEKRYFHLGLDICAPAGTKVYAPLDGVVEESGYEEGEGNYGGYTILKHIFENCEPFYSLYGHMNTSSLMPMGRALKAGDEIGVLGDLHENGGWNHHTHVQIITEQGRKEGFFFKGYCCENRLKNIENLCPSPVPLLTAGMQNR